MVPALATTCIVYVMTLITAYCEPHAKLVLDCPHPLVAGPFDLHQLQLTTFTTWQAKTGY